MAVTRKKTTKVRGPIPGKKIGSAEGHVAANNRYKWVEFVASNDDGEPYVVRCKVRTSLTNGEIEDLAQIESSDGGRTLNQALAPYVVEWNVTWVEGDDLYAVSPPAESNGDAFDYAPRGLGHAIVNSIMLEPFKSADPKS